MGTAQAVAQLWLGGTDFRAEYVDLPDITDGELLIDLSVAAVCGSDRHTVTGRRSGPYPSILGHEGMGTVVASTRPGIAVGDRVVFSVTDSCGDCQRCRAGMTAKCVSVRKVGHEPYGGNWLLNGTYASHIHIQAGQAVESLPDHVTDDAAAVAGCSIATVMAALEQAGPLNGRTVLINGLGMLGLTAVVAARAAGAAKVIAVDPHEQARTMAQGLAGGAADEVGAALAPDTVVDVVLELSGVRAGVQTALSALDLGGVAVLAGSVAPTSPVNLDPEWVVRGWRTITGVHNYEPRHLGAAVAFLDEHQNVLPWEEIIGRRYGLDDLPDAFLTTSTGLRDVIDLHM